MKILKPRFALSEKDIPGDKIPYRKCTIPQFQAF